MRALTKLSILALACTFCLTGCLFMVEHELPPNAYFGRLPSPIAKQVDRFENQAMKNWYLAGLFPYSDWSSEDLFGASGRGSREYVEDLAIETRFGTLDTIVWVVPGFFYGYYLWAPRTVEVSGSRVRRAPDE